MVVRIFCGDFYIANHRQYSSLFTSQIDYIFFDIPTRLLTNNKWLLIHGMAEGKDQSGTIHNVFMMNIGRATPLSDIRHHLHKSKHMISVIKILLKS